MPQGFGDVRPLGLRPVQPITGDSGLETPATDPGDACARYAGQCSARVDSAFRRLPPFPENTAWPEPIDRHPVAVARFARIVNQWAHVPADDRQALGIRKHGPHSTTPTSSMISAPRASTRSEAFRSRSSSCCHQSLARLGPVLKGTALHQTLRQSTRLTQA